MTEPTTLAAALIQLVGSFDIDMVNKQLYLDFAPPQTIPPYMTYNDYISAVPDLKGDGKAIAFGRTMQINLWQKPSTEDPTLLSALVSHLDGASLTVAGANQSPRIAVSSFSRLEEPYEAELVHHQITIEIAHVVGIS